MTVYEVDRRFLVPPFLSDENPAHERYHEAVQVFALYETLKAQGFGVFSIRESLQAVGERYDGTLQGFHLSVDEAWEAVRFVNSLGVGVVELPAFPANKYGQAFNRTLIERAQAADMPIVFAAHARCVPIDVESAIATGFKRLHLYIGTSKIKQATARATVAQLAHKAAESIILARKLGATSVRISTEDAFRTSIEDYREFYESLVAELKAQNDGVAHVNGVGIPDTVGLATMDELGDRIAVLRSAGLEFDWLECHVHNDIGNADQTYIDTLLLCQRLGITMLPDFSILGIGERNGTIGLSSLLEAIYRRLILLYPRKMAAIRQAMRETLGSLPNGELFVNRYRDMDSFFYRLLARTGFFFDRSPFSANTEFDGSGVHADTTGRAYKLALAQDIQGQDAIDIGNSAYSGALPPYDTDLRTPVLACFGCGKANVRYWREREKLTMRSSAEIQQNISGIEEIEKDKLQFPLDESVADELIAQLIRLFSIRDNGISHHEAMDLIQLFYARSEHEQA